MRRFDKDFLDAYIDWETLGLYIDANLALLVNGDLDDYDYFKSLLSQSSDHSEMAREFYENYPNEIRIERWIDRDECRLYGVDLEQYGIETETF